MLCAVVVSVAVDPCSAAAQGGGRRGLASPWVGTALTATMMACLRLAARTRQRAVVADNSGSVVSILIVGQEVRIPRSLWCPDVVQGWWRRGVDVDVNVDVNVAVALLPFVVAAIVALALARPTTVLY